MINIEKLLQEVNYLKSLLEDPHPGLTTWHDAYLRRLKEISSYYTGDGGDDYNWQDPDQNPYLLTGEGLRELKESNS